MLNDRVTLFDIRKKLQNENALNACNETLFRYFSQTLYVLKCQTDTARSRRASINHELFYVLIMYMRPRACFQSFIRPNNNNNNNIIPLKKNNTIIISKRM